MVKLKHYQWDFVQSEFCPEPGYVLKFTNKTFAGFFDDHFATNIYSDVFAGEGTSKYNRLRSFIKASPPHIVIELLNLLWAEKNRGRDQEIEKVSHAVNGDWGTANIEQLEFLVERAAIEDEHFSKLVNEIGARPAHTSEPLLRRLSSDWTLDTVTTEFERALENIDKDPEASITAASSLLESICRSIVVGRGSGLPKNMDIQSLYKPVRDILSLNPSTIGDIGEVENDVRQILSALFTTVSGVGALRTHTGTAHGREKGFRRVDPRIARLAVNTAATISLFLIETWERKFPDDKLQVSSEVQETLPSSTSARDQGL